MVYNDTTLGVTSVETEAVGMLAVVGVATRYTRVDEPSLNPWVE